MRRQRDMTVNVVRYGQLRPLAHGVTFLSRAPTVVATHMTTFQSGRIDGATAGLLKQFQLLRNRDAGCQERLPDPLFRNVVLHATTS